LEQQALGNEFQEEVYGNGDTRPGVLYTTITSTHDEVVTPYTQQALDGPNVTNIVIQDLYPGVLAGHEGIVLSPQVWSVVLDALASNPAANPLAHDEELAVRIRQAVATHRLCGRSKSPCFISPRLRQRSSWTRSLCLRLPRG